MEIHEVSENPMATNKGMKSIHFILYFWIYLLQSVFAVHFGSIANYYFKKNLGYSWQILALINFLVYLPLIAKPGVYLLLQRNNNTVDLRKLLLPFTGLYVILAVLSGFITASQSPVLMLISMFFMQTSLIFVDLGMDSYFLVQYQQHSIGISLMQIASGIVGAQLVYLLVAVFTDYFAAQSWLTYFILLGSVGVPIFLLVALVMPKAVDIPARDYSGLKKLEPQVKKRLKWLLVFLAGINITYLSGSIMDIFLPERFGEQAYINQIGAVSQLWGILGIVIMLLFSIRPKFFRRWRFAILYVVGVVVAGGFVAMVYTPLSVYMVFRIAGIILTYVFQAVYLSLMIDVIPKSVLPPFYQVCAMIFAVTRAVLEPAGILLSMVVGLEVTILLTAGLMLLNIPILVVFNHIITMEIKKS